jgi:hypothetical protein
MTGTIKTLTDKGFGFINVEGQEKDLFFHTNSLVGVQFNELRFCFGGLTNFIRDYCFLSLWPLDFSYNI